MKPTLTHLSVLIFALSVAAILYGLASIQEDCRKRGGILVSPPYAPHAAFVCVKELERKS